MKIDQQGDLPGVGLVKFSEQFCGNSSPLLGRLEEESRYTRILIVKTVL